MFNLLIADARNLEPMAGLTDLLAWLGEQRFGIAIASSSRPEQVNLIIKNLNLDRYFDAIVGNDGSMKPKPAPDVYLLALQQLNADPAQTLALEDSSSGVQAAHNAGLYVIAVPNRFTRHQDFSVADCIMQNLHEVRSFLGDN
jgi:HAD superfamily hydrolase (TIGR01509 family)